MTQHTPGPWELDDEFVVYGSNRAIAWVYPTQFQSGDAALIAAAPDLLAALKVARTDLLELAENDQHLAPAIERIDTALAKAS